MMARLVRICPRPSYISPPSVPSTPSKGLQACGYCTLVHVYGVPERPLLRYISGEEIL